LRTDSAKACGGCKYNPKGGDKCPLLDDNGRSFKQGENSDAASGKKPPEKSAINTKEKEEVVATKFVEISIGKPHLTHTCVGTAYTINTTWSISGTNKKVIVWYYRNGSIIGDDLPPSNFSHFPIRSNIASKGDNITVKVQQYEGTVSNSSSFVYQGCTLTPVKILKQL
jgi:hypothetical protein